jgi:hypothetical protein
LPWHKEKSNVQWKCDKPAVQHTINVGDKPGHAYAIDQINCTATKGEIAGVKIESGTGTEFLDIKGDKTTGQGEFVENMENAKGNPDGLLYSTAWAPTRPQRSSVAKQHRSARTHRTRVKSPVMYGA